MQFQKAKVLPTPLLYAQVNMDGANYFKHPSFPLFSVSGRYGR